MKKLFLLLFIPIFVSGCKDDKEKSYEDFKIHIENETNYGIIVVALDDNGRSLGTMKCNQKSTNINQFAGAKKVILYLKWYEIGVFNNTEVKNATASITNPKGRYNIIFAGENYDISKE